MNKVWTQTFFRNYKAMLRRIQSQIGGTDKSVTKLNTDDKLENRLKELHKFRNMHQEL